MSLSDNRFPVRSDRPLVLAHRGASAEAPENTLPAFRLAVEQGADGVELDVMLCGSGEAVVCHDETLGRLAGVPERVDLLPYSMLRNIDVGSRFSPDFKGERVPLFAEVLDDLPQGLVVNVELKCDRTLDGGLARKVAAALAADGTRHRVVVSSFNPMELARMRVFGTDVATGLLFEPEGALWLRHGFAAFAVASASVHPRHDICGAAFVARWHDRGYRVVTWTVDEPEELERVADAGVDAVITNRPAEALTVLRARAAGHPSTSQ